MTRLGRSPFSGLCLLVGALSFGVAGLRHPILRGDGAVQLATIARTTDWPGIHWALLLGMPLMLAGLAGLALRHRGTPGMEPAGTALLVAAFGFAIWILNILFMAGAGWHLARTYVAAEPGLAATHAVFLYDMLHPFGLAAERVATCTMGLALSVLGWGIRAGRVFAPWLSWSAFAVGVGCVGIALAVRETSVVLFYGQAGLVAWMAAAGVALLVARRSGA
jgi:hypothetical protein